MTADLEARIRVLEERGDQLAAAASAALMSGGTPSTATERIRTAVYAWEADRRHDDGQAVTDPSAGGTVAPPTSYRRTVLREVTATEFHDIVENTLQRPRPEVCLPCTLGLPCPNLPKEPTP